MGGGIVTGRLTFLSAALLAGALQALAVTPVTDHVFRLDKDEPRPAATLADVSMLVGAWRGEAFGKTFEETWNLPSAGSMVGMFKLVDGDDVAFYELMLLVEEEGSVSMKVKHFNPDFSAWEEKAEHVTFHFIRSDQDELHFSGLSFYRDSDDTLTGYIAMRSEGELREEKLVLRRVEVD